MTGERLFVFQHPGWRIRFARSGCFALSLAMLAGCGLADVEHARMESGDVARQVAALRPPQAGPRLSNVRLIERRPYVGLTRIEPDPRADLPARFRRADAVTLPLAGIGAPATLAGRIEAATGLAVRFPDTPTAVVTETAQTEAMTDSCPSGYIGSQEYRRTATRRATQFPWDAEPIVQINYGPWILGADNCEAVIPPDWGGDGGGGEGDGGAGGVGDDSCDTASTPDDPGSDVCSVDSSIGFDTDTSGLGDGGNSDAGDGGACFLTTAIVERRGIEADGGPTLTALRRFRDGYMMKTSKRRALVAEYYELAPRIVAAIPETHSDWDWIGGRIDAAIAAIAAGDEDGAFGIYAAMVRRLAASWTEPGSRMAACANTTKGARR